MSHTGQILLVVADTEEEALDAVRSAITYNDVPNPDWSDWHEIGGRWDGQLEGKNVMQYHGNEAKAEEFIAGRLAERRQEMEYLLEKSKDITLEDAHDQYDPEVENFKYSMNVYYHEKLAKVLQDDWTTDSYVYDLEVYTANLKYFRERLEKEPEKQFLVVVDFHF